MNLTMPHFKLSEMKEDRVNTTKVLILLAILILAPILIVSF